MTNQQREQAIEKIAQTICNFCMAARGGCPKLLIKPCELARDYASNTLDDIESLGMVFREEDQSLPNCKRFRWFNENIGIDIRIEGWTATVDELQWYLEMLQERLHDLDIKDEFPGARRISDNVHQLPLFNAIIC